MSETAVRSSVVMTEDEALNLVHDGMTIGLGGFNTAAHPMVIVRGLIRRGLKDLRVVGSTIGGLDLDMLIGAGVASEVVTSGVTGEGLASVGPMFRWAAESGKISVWECDEGIAYAALRAAGQGLPFLPWKAGVGTSLPDLNPALRLFTDPIGGEQLLAVPAINIDVTFLHVARADIYGMGQHIGSGFGDRLLHRASEKTVLTTEDLVPNEAIRADSFMTSIPNADGVVVAPWGAHPFSNPGTNLVDEQHLSEYVAAGATALQGDWADFDAYMDRYVRGPISHLDYLDRIGLRRLLSLKEWI